MSRTFFEEVTDEEQIKFLIFLIDVSFHFNVSVLIVKVQSFYFFTFEFWAQKCGLGEGVRHAIGVALRSCSRLQNR